MAGWRLGWLLVPPDHVAAAKAYIGNLFLTPPSLSQHAGLIAMDCIDELEGHIEVYRKNRELVLAALPSLGLKTIAPPDGAFYVWADIAHLTEDSVAFCEQLLRDTGVATAPGVDFDPVDGHRFMRFSFAVSTPLIEEALESATALVRRARSGRRLIHHADRLTLQGDAGTGGSPVERAGVLELEAAHSGAVTEAGHGADERLLPVPLLHDEREAIGPVPGRAHFDPRGKLHAEARSDKGGHVAVATEKHRSAVHLGAHRPGIGLRHRLDDHKAELVGIGGRKRRPRRVDERHLHQGLGHKQAQNHHRRLPPE
jgi:hypothetical protein